VVRGCGSAWEGTAGGKVARQAVGVGGKRRLAGPSGGRWWAGGKGMVLLSMFLMCFVLLATGDKLRCCSCAAGDKMYLYSRAAGDKIICWSQLVPAHLLLEGA